VTKTKYAQHRIGDSRADGNIINFLFAIGLRFRAENSLLSNRIIISTFCSFTGQTFGQKVINCPAIANAWTLAEMVPEPILFSIYGKGNITKQRPYEIYFIDNHWVIIGTLPKDYLGGTFLIIIDSKDSKIIRITYGK